MLGLTAFLLTVAAVGFLVGWPSHVLSQRPHWTGWRRSAAGPAARLSGTRPSRPIETAVVQRPGVEAEQRRTTSLMRPPAAR